MPIFRRQSEAPRERTAEDRERARREREARRTGRPLQPDELVAPTQDFEALLDEPETNGAAAHIDLEHDAVEPGEIPSKADDGLPYEFDWDEGPTRDVAEERDDFAGDRAEFAPEPPPEDAGEEEAPPEPHAEASVDLDQPTAPFDPIAGEPPPSEVVEVPAEPEPEPEPQPEPEPEPIIPPAKRRASSGRFRGPDDDEPPTPVRRVSARERTLPPTPPPPGAPAFTKRRRRRGRILAFVALAVMAVIAYGVILLFQPFHGDPGERVTVRIPPNSSTAEVGDILADADIVNSSLLFTLRARLAGADLEAGTYRLNKDSSYGQALDALQGDPAAPRTVKVVIPEGRARSETAPLVQDAGLEGSYLKASDTHEGFSPRRYGAPRNTRTLEGFLFPATYELRPGDSAQKLVGQQLEAFERNIAEVDMKRADRRNLTPYDVLIIASMVEREASLAKERPIIAAVIHNRLRQGMPLGIDATIRYATRNWQNPIKQSDLQMDSAFNTYRRTGLPPTPIGSPGLDSMKAAANPAKVDYLYYVIRPNGDGAHNFSSTDEEFQRDVEAYNRERERRGGKSPASSDG